MSFYCENVILCENLKNSIFAIKSHFQSTQLLQGRMANRSETLRDSCVGLGRLEDSKRENIVIRDVTAKLQIEDCEILG